MQIEVTDFWIVSCLNLTLLGSWQTVSESYHQYYLQCRNEINPQREGTEVKKKGRESFSLNLHLESGRNWECCEDLPSLSQGFFPFLLLLSPTRIGLGGFVSLLPESCEVQGLLSSSSCRRAPRDTKEVRLKAGPGEEGDDSRAVLRLLTVPCAPSSNSPPCPIGLAGACSTSLSVIALSWKLPKGGPWGWNTAKA